MLCLLWQWVGCFRGAREGQRACRQGQGPPRSLALLHPIAQTEAGAGACISPASCLELLAARQAVAISLFDIVSFRLSG